MTTRAQRAGGGAVLFAALVGGLLLFSDPRPGPQRVRGRLPRWPLATGTIQGVGDDLGEGRNHQGIDIAAPAGTPVVAPEDLKIIRVVNGTKGSSESQHRAGQWVDAEGVSGYLLRFLHLREDDVKVRAGQAVRQGELIGYVAPKGTSGVYNSNPHLHFEVRQPAPRGEVYGAVVNPLAVLPELGRPEVDKRIAAARAAEVPA